MRVNFTLNPSTPNDKIIIEFLERRYNATGYIKDLLYQVATNQPVMPATIGTIVNAPVDDEEFEDIDVDNIDL